MKRNIQKLFYVILLVFLLSSISIISKAALDYSITSGISKIDEGKTYTISIKATGLTGRFNITHSSNVSVNCSSVWVENGVADTTIKVTANSEGNATVTVSPESVASAETGELVSLSSKTDRVTVEAEKVEEPDENTTEDNNTTDDNNTTGDNTTNDNKNEEDDKKEDDKKEETEKKPTFTSANKKMYTTDDNVNLRSSWSTSSSATTLADKGTELTVTGISTDKVNGYIWYRVEYNGATKYIASSLLTSTKPEVEKEEDKKEDEEKDEKEENEKSNNKSLKSLEVDPIGLSPEFDKDTLQYAMTVKSDVDEIKIKAEAEDENAKVTISGNKDLKVGDNTITIKVTAEDETVRTYKIIVTKESKDQVKLDELLIAGITLTPEFDSSIYEYDIKLDANTNITEIDITATPDDKEATVEILGNTNLKVGNNVVTILVKSGEDKITTYQINVEIPQVIVADEKEEENNSELYKYIAIGVLAAIVIIAIIVLIVKRKNDDNEFEDDREEDEEIDYLYDEEDFNPEIVQKGKSERRPFIEVNEDVENTTDYKKDVIESEADIERKKKIDEFYANVDTKSGNKKGKHF